ncbi:putative N-6 adenine-specific DNA methyltransferase 1 (putative), partial [Planoprotostelium fungivorum]
HCQYYAIDINPIAARAAKETARRANIPLDIICGDLVSPLSRMKGSIDVLLFNPPYVPTSMEEYLESIDTSASEHDVIAAAWAGGPDGRCVLDRLLPIVGEYLSPNGRFYLVTVEENRPKEICSILKKQNLDGQKVIDRKARNEHLSIYRFTKRVTE